MKSLKIKEKGLELESLELYNKIKSSPVSVDIDKEYLKAYSDEVIEQLDRRGLVRWVKGSLELQ